MLDFFSYNPVSSAYPRAGIVNLYTKNVPVIAAMLKSALKNETLTSPPATGVVSQTEATHAANAIVTATQSVLAGTASPAVQQTDLTRAIAGRLANVGQQRRRLDIRRTKGSNRPRARGDGTNPNLESVHRCDRANWKVCAGRARI